MPRTNKKLTDKQKRFVDEYLVDLNATAAARRAGYSESNADQIASRLVGKSQVKEAIAERQECLQARTEVTQDWVINRLKNLAERALEYNDAPHMQVVNKSLELLGKHLGLYTEKVSLKGEITVASILQELEQYERHKTSEETQ